MPNFDLVILNPDSRAHLSIMFILSTIFVTWDRTLHQCCRESVTAASLAVPMTAPITREASAHVRTLQYPAIVGHLACAGNTVLPWYL